MVLRTWPLSSKISGEEPERSSIVEVSIAPLIHIGELVQDAEQPMYHVARISLFPVASCRDSQRVERGIQFMKGYLTDENGATRFDIHRTRKDRFLGRRLQLCAMSKDEYLKAAELMLPNLSGLATDAPTTTCGRKMLNSPQRVSVQKGGSQISSPNRRYSRPQSNYLSQNYKQSLRPRMISMSQQAERND